MNVLLVVLEGARADHLGCYGYERETTPFLDQLAREGVRFTAAFTHRAVGAGGACLAADRSVRPSLHGATEESGALPPGDAAAAGVAARRRVSHRGVLPDPGGEPGDRPRARLRPLLHGARQGRITGRAADYARRASDRVLGRGDAGARRTTQALLEWVAATAVDAVLRAASSTASRRARLRAAGAVRPHVRARRRRVDPRAAWHDGALRYVDMRLQRGRRRAGRRRALGSHAGRGHRDARPALDAAADGDRGVARRACCACRCWCAAPGADSARVRRSMSSPSSTDVAADDPRAGAGGGAGCADAGPGAAAATAPRRRARAAPSPRPFAATRRATCAARRSARGARSSSGSRTRPTRSTTWPAIRESGPNLAGGGSRARRPPAPARCSNGSGVAERWTRDTAWLAAAARRRHASARRSRRVRRRGG